MLYLASPYSDPRPAVRQARYEAALRATAALIRQGIKVFSPIVYGHEMFRQGLLPKGAGGSDYWLEFDSAMLATCTGMAVLRCDGWRESEGVTRERSMATAARKPIVYLDPETMEVRDEP